ncbi:MAG: TerB N-terminal domain-containing protein [Bacteroidota bacterium]
MKIIKDYVAPAFILIVSFFIWSSSNLGMSLFFFILVSGTFGWIYLKFSDSLDSARKLIISSICAFPLLFAYWGGAGPFFVGLIISFITYLVLRMHVPEFKNGNVSVMLSGKSVTKKPFQAKRPYFAGKDGQLEVGGHIITNPMTYVVDSKEFNGFDASLLCLKRRIERSQQDQSQSLPYWPQLSDCNPSQVGLYLEWMANCKRRSKIAPPGGRLKIVPL